MITRPELLSWLLEIANAREGHSDAEDMKVDAARMWLSLLWKGDKMKETYLGDGLYASYHEGANSIKLRAPRFAGGSSLDHEVYLEPETFLAMIKFAKQFFFWKIDSEVLQCHKRGSPKTT